MAKYCRACENPHIQVVQQPEHENFIFEMMAEHLKGRDGGPLRILDIGGGSGWDKLRGRFANVEYYILDLELNNKEGKYIKGDITSKGLELPYEFDIVFTRDTFEHILNPWDATTNVRNALKEGGLFVFLAPFSWRYHPVPFDTYRYSHTGARYIFEREGGMKNIFAGYIPYGPILGFWKNKKDCTHDRQPFPACLETIYIAKKSSGYVFNLAELDSDFSPNHSG